ncbi:MAG TPA: hypothetical protein PKE07_14805 [Lacibacter sp.]|nr:hypothetical protein [Lacibacter sp.]HMO90483.1 hypothetical protein [Lacibacter sp.]
MASNQLTLQHTIATHWKIKTEAEFSTDRLHQAVVSAQLLVDSTRIVRRREEQAFLSKQTQWRINQEVEFNPGSNRQFKGNVSYLQRVHNQEHTRIIEQGTISESIPSLFSGHTSVWQGSLLFTHRLNGQKARTLAYTFHRELFTPRQEAQNSQYPLLLSSPPGFQQAQLNQQALWLRQELKWESFRKRGHHIRSGHYFLRHQSLMVNHRFELGTEQQPAQQKIEALSGQSWLEGVEIGYGSEVKYERSSRFRFNMNGELGLSAMSRREWEVRRQLMPLVRGKALVFRKLNRVFSLSSHLQADLQPLPLTSQVQFRRAVSPLQFQESRLPLMAIPEYLMILNLGYSESLMRTSGLQFYFRQRLVSELFMPSYNGLLSWNTLSLVKQPTNLYNVTLYKTVFFAVQKRKLDFSASSSINEFLQINQDARTIKTAFLFSSLSASFETEYGNHHFVRTSLWATRFQTLSFIKNDAGFGRSLLRYRAEFFNRYRVSARASIAASCQYFHFRPAVAQPLTLVFADVVATWRPGKWKHDITFKGENLLNQKSYLLLTGSAFEVSQTSIPLIGRNLQVAVKFNF